MAKKILVVSVILLLGVVLYSWHVSNKVADPQQTMVLGPTQLAAESKGSLRLFVRDYNRNEPLKNTEIKVSLRADKTISLGTTSTDAQGNAQLAFDVPNIPEGSYQLEIATRSNVGSDFQVLPVTVKRDLKILLNTDKPLYQPGQKIHIRSLTMNNFSVKPAQKKDILIEVLDPKGNKVFKQKLQTSDFGIAACDFQLASEVNEGEYRLKAECGKVTEEKKVTVKRYVLPKFKVSSSFSQAYYMPGQSVSGNITAQYIFGKPVTNGKVEVKVSTLDVNFHDLLSWQGTTDAAGNCKVSFDLPKKLYGSALQKGSALVKVDIKVTDTGDHTQQITQNLTVSDTPIHAVAIAGSSNIVSGVVNRIYICTTYPDGSPAKTTITIGNQEIATNALGIAEWQVTPQSGMLKFSAKIRDDNGNQIDKNFTISSANQGDFVTVLNKAAYKSGEEVDLQILSSKAHGNFYVDVIKEQQSIVSYTIEAENGKHRKIFALPQDISGTLTLHTYQVGFDSVIQRDTKLIFVSPGTDLAIQTQLDKESYRPGDQATIRFETNQPETALSLAIVDESVFALQEMQPGIEKVYFMLHQELLKPKYQIRYAPPISQREMVSLPQNQQDSTTSKEEQKQLEQDKQQAAKVMFAIASGDNLENSLQRADSYQPKLERVREAKEQYFSTLATVVYCLPFGFVILLCLVAFIQACIKVKNHSSLVYEDTHPARHTLNGLYFHYRMLIVCIFAFFLMGILYEMFSPRKTMAILYFVILLAVFCGLFSWTTERKLHKGWLALAILIAAFAVFSILGEDEWGQRRKIGKAMVVINIIMIGKAFLLSLGYSIRYFFHKQRLTASTSAVASTFLLLVGIAVGITGLIVAEDSYSLRRMIDHDWREIAPTFCAIAVVLFFPVFSVYLRSFLYQTSGKRLVSSFLTICLVVFVCFVATPTLGSVGERAKMQAIDEMNVQQEFTATMDKADSEGMQTVTSSQPKEQQQGVRIRKFFPETLYWNPQLLTQQGRAQIQIPVSDSITTFRMVCQGVSKEGLLGSTTQSIRVFQDFFVDIDFPVSLTQDDEISVPVQIYNYLPGEQQVKLVVEKQDWFEMLGDHEQQVTMESGQVGVVYFRIRAKRVGQKNLTVFAYGSKMNDAIRRTVEVVPNGKKMEQVYNGSISKTTSHQCMVPENAIPEASKIIAKCYPGVTSVLVEGLEGMLHMPGG